tara:strand:- start:526 stop:750 length:225 start_codon:yes stop_codon:yes gene_type:complete
MSLRSNVRDLKANKKPIYVLEAELFDISQQNKLNKDARNRKKRLEQVIIAKKYAAMKIQEKIEKELEKEKNVHE